MIVVYSRPALLRMTIAGSLLLAYGSMGAAGQAVPVISSNTPTEAFRFPSVNGSLQYSLTAAESVVYGYNGQPNTGASAVTSFSGDLAYLSKSRFRPFSAVYSGGYLIGNGDQPSSPFQNLALSQVITTRSWNYVLSDTVSYLPQSPTTGLSGIPGLGDIGVSGGAVGTSQLGILTTYSRRIVNDATVSVSRPLTGSTSLHATGNYDIQRFLGNSVGLDNTQEVGSGGVAHRFDARTSAGADYSYSHVSLGASGLSYTSQSLLFQVTRQLTRQLSLTLGAGPQRVNTGNQPSTNVTVNSALGYTTAKTNYSLNYFRGVTTGDGVIAGAHTDSLNFSASRTINRSWAVSGLVGYNRSCSLPNGLFPAFTNTGVVTSGQASRMLVHALSLFASYTLQRQGIQGTAAVNNPFNGLSQVLSFGLSYSPKPFLGRR